MYYNGVLEGVSERVLEGILVGTYYNGVKVWVGSEGVLEGVSEWR